MRITPDMTIAGISAVKLRDAFRARRDTTWSAACLSESLGFKEEDAARIAAGLLAEGYVQVAFEHVGEPRYTTTTRGGALASASSAKPITRRTADRLLGELLQRAATVNAAPEYIHNVTRLYVFGSYLTDRPDLGDLDVAFELTAKFAGEEFLAACARYADLQIARGRRVPSFLASLALPETDILKALQGTSRAISLHAASELEVLGVEKHRLVYQYP